MCSWQRTVHWPLLLGAKDSGSPRHACLPTNAMPPAPGEANKQHQQQCARAEDRRTSAAQAGLFGRLTGEEVSTRKSQLFILTWPAER